jgi:hypothetical protein
MHQTRERVAGETRRSHDLLELFPFSLIVELLSAMGRAADFLKDRRRKRNVYASKDQVTVPPTDQSSLAMPVATVLPLSPSYGELKAQAEELRKGLQRVTEEKREVESQLVEATAAPVQRSGPVTRILMEEESEANKQLRREIAEVRLARDELLNERNALQARINRYEQEEKTRENQPVAHGGFKVTEQMLNGLLAYAFPNIAFQPGSIKFLIEQAHNQDRTLATLGQLDEHPGSVRGERVETADGWIEVKFGKGGATEDRLYFRHHSETGKCLVLLSKKRMQKRDLSGLT